MSNPPILLIVFNRVETTRTLLAALRPLAPARLYVAADGPRPDHPEDEHACDAVRALFDDLGWDCEVVRLFRDENLGLRRGVPDAISWFFNHVSEGVVLEDDCIPSAHFISFAAAMLERYRHDERIMHVTGSSFVDVPPSMVAPYYFSRLPLIWGWATWRRAWLKFDLEMADFEQFRACGGFKRVLPTTFTRKYWTTKIAWQASPVGDNWDFSWVYAVLKNNGLCVNPWPNLVQNVGADSGFHAGVSTSALTSRRLGGAVSISPAPPVEPNREVDDRLTKLLATEQWTPRMRLGEAKARASRKARQWLQRD